MTSPTTEEILAAITLDGDRTRSQLAARFEIDLSPVRDYRDAAEMTRCAPAGDLSAKLRNLHCDGLLAMRVVRGEWHYRPTRKAKLATSMHVR